MTQDYLRDAYDLGQTLGDNFLALGADKAFPDSNSLPIVVQKDQFAWSQELLQRPSPSEPFTLLKAHNDSTPANAAAVHIR